MHDHVRVISTLFLLAAILTAGGGSPAQTNDYSDTLRRVPAQYRGDVQRVLSLAAAEWNESELMEALEHFPAGSAKHRAVCFLIANLDKQAFIDYVNPNRPLDPFRPEDEEVDWVREYVWDYGEMSAELLIENVEWAFVARERFRWCRSLPESVFFEYVLPYRSTEEPLASWRPRLLERLAPMVEGLRTSLEATETINRYLTEEVEFDSWYWKHPEDRDIWTLLGTKVGRCEDLSNIAIYCLRSVGIPVAVDSCPWWPNRDNNHAWNAVHHDGEWYSFMGCEAKEDPVWNREKNVVMAKVWRQTFSADPIMPPAPDGTLPPRLMRRAAIDVTGEYMETSDVRVRVNNPYQATYLCVYNFSAWRANAGAFVENGTAFFPHVGHNNYLFCATRFVEDETGWGDHYPVAVPFVLHPDGSMEYINPDPGAERLGDITLTRYPVSLGLESGEPLTLFRYMGDDPLASERDDSEESFMSWVAIASEPVEEVEGVEDENPTGRITFADVAVERGLYILSNSDDPEELVENSRPFVWSGGEIRYY